MEMVIWQWVDMAVRWLHVIAGIAWIGSSFYFVHLDLSIKPREDLPKEAGGEAWQVHGGGFYHMVKYLVAPARMPEKLIWFKWEAYTTWLSGMALMVLVYYMAADLYMIDRQVLDISPLLAVVLSLGFMAFGWIAYDLLCRSPLGRNDVALAAVGFVFLVALAYLFTFIFSGRGAFMQLGVVVGTIMVANVFFIIIPNQRKVVNDLLAKREPDPEHGRAAKQRSLHNNYLTLPVVFVMIGNHYPLAFASQWNWLILAIVLVMGALIRHFFNVRHKGETGPWWTWAGAAAGFVAIVLLSAQPASEAEEAALPADLDLSEVEVVVQSRCSMCHTAEPLWPGIGSPPKGVVLETPEQMRRQSNAIDMQAVRTHAMPPGNITEMEEEERQLLAHWVAAGAPGW